MERSRGVGSASLGSSGSGCGLTALSVIDLLVTPEHPD
jgi:hypothetical protein